MRSRNMRSEAAACSVIVAAIIYLSGCAGVTDSAKGILGVSTKVLVDGKPSAIKATYPVGYLKCRDTVNGVLSENKVYVYARDESKKMIAFYLTANDTTPAGVFFSAQNSTATEVAVASPSRYAKEFISDKIAARFNTVLNEAPEPAAAAVNQTEPGGKK